MHGLLLCKIMLRTAIALHFLAVHLQRVLDESCYIHVNIAVFLVKKVKAENQIQVFCTVLQTTNHSKDIWMVQKKHVILKSYPDWGFF